MEGLHSLLFDNCELILESGFTKPLTRVNVEDIPNVVQTVTLHSHSAVSCRTVAIQRRN